MELLVRGLLERPHPVARLDRALFQQLVLALDVPVVTLELPGLFVVAIRLLLLLTQLAQRFVLGHLLRQRLLRQRQLVLQVVHPLPEDGGVLLPLQLRILLLVVLEHAVGLLQLARRLGLLHRGLGAPLVHALLLQRLLERVAHLHQLGFQQLVLLLPRVHGGVQLRQVLRIVGVPGVGAAGVAAPAARVPDAVRARLAVRRLLRHHGRLHERPQ